MLPLLEAEFQDAGLVVCCALLYQYNAYGSLRITQGLLRKAMKAAEKLTSDPRLLARIQHPLRINPSLQIPLRALTQLKVLDRHLPHKAIVLLKSLPLLHIKIIELHPRRARLPVRRGTHPELRHPAPVDIQRAVGEEEQEEPVVRLVRVREVLRPVVVVDDVVAVRRVEGREGGVRVGAVQTFLVAVDHGFPAEVAWVFEGAAVGPRGEVDGVEFLL